MIARFRKTMGTKTVTQEKVQRRRRRIVLSTTFSYLLTALVFAVVCLVDEMQWLYLGYFLIMTALINGSFYLVVRLDLNLSLRNSDLAVEQMLASLLPPLYCLYHVENMQARSAVLLIVFVPLVYGILGLKKRDFLRVGLVNVACCCGLIAVLWWRKPWLVEPSIEAIQLSVLIVVIGQLAAIGGYISHLRADMHRNNVKLNEALETISEMASTDELTGINNRRALLEKLEHEQSRCSRGGTCFSVCLVDVDFFKRINDTFGHSAGDLVLKDLAQLMSDCLRSIDCVGRYGGEEFLLILPQTPLDKALLKAEKLRESVESMRFDGIQKGFSITVSIGVVEYRSKEKVEQTIARADLALYAAKDGGRNRIVSETTLAAPARI